MTLRNARLVEAEKRGVFVTYRIADRRVDDFYGMLRSLAEARLAEVQQIAHAFVEGRDGLEPVDRQRLLERVRADEVTVLDVRPVEEYRAAHLRRSTLAALVARRLGPTAVLERAL